MTPFGITTALPRSKIDGTILEIDQEPAADHVEELIFVIVFVPMIFAVDDSEPDDRLVHFAQRLVVPLIGAGTDETAGRRSFPAAREEC